MTPGYVHASKRETQKNLLAEKTQQIVQLNAIVREKDRKLNQAQDDLAQAEEPIRNLAKANATLVAEVQALKAKAKQAPAPVEPARDENALLIDALEADNKRLREEKSTLLEERQALEIEKAILSNRLAKTQQAAKAYRETTGAVTAQMEQMISAIVPGQVLTISETGEVTIHQRDADPVRLAQTLRQAAEAVTAQALSQELA